MSTTPISRLIASLAQRFSNNDNDPLADVIVECDGGRKQFRAHRFILSLNTAEFERLIYSSDPASPSGQPLPIVRLNDVSTAAMTLLLQLLYGGRDSVSNEEAIKLLPLTRQLRVDAAESLCCRKMIAQMSDDNVLSFLQIGMVQGAEMLSQAAMEFLCEKAQATSLDAAIIDHRQVIGNTERSVVARLIDALKVIGKQEAAPPAASSSDANNNQDSSQSTPIQPKKRRGAGQWVFTEKE